jgi:hypothetical protein
VTAATRPPKTPKFYSLIVTLIFFPASSIAVMAEQLQWQLEAYGGNYYGSDHAALYGVFTQPLPVNLSVTLEAFYEKVDDYKFQGIGGHLLWHVTDNTQFGIVGSAGVESYPFYTYLGETLIDRDDERYDLSSTAFELESNLESLTIAAQVGRFFLEDHGSTHRDYSSIDAYYWGTDYTWYLRGVDQRTGDDALSFVEGYRSWAAPSLPTTLYLGLATGEYESVYAGAYVELASSEYSSWTLDLGAGYTDGEWQLQLELYLLIGPGAEAPYITAFGFSVGD